MSVDGLNTSVGWNIFRELFTEFR